MIKEGYIREWNEFVPSCAGLIIAGEVVRELLYGKDKKTDSSGI